MRCRRCGKVTVIENYAMKRVRMGYAKLSKPFDQRAEIVARDPAQEKIFTPPRSFPGTHALVCGLDGSPEACGAAPQPFVNGPHRRKA